MKNIEEGENTWVFEDDYNKIKNTYVSYKKWVEAIDTKSIKYIERKELVRSY